MQVGRSQLLKKIKNCYPFYRLSDREASELIEYSEVLFFEKGNLIFKEGSAANNLYLILEGEISILREYRGAVINLLSRRDGGLFGEDVLTGKKVRRTTARAEDNLMVLKIPSKFIGQLDNGKAAVLNSLKIILTTYENLIQRRREAISGESIYYYGCPHIFFLLKKVFLYFFGLIAFMLVNYAFQRQYSATKNSVIIFSLSLTIIFLLISFWNYFEWQRNTFMVSNVRVTVNSIRLFRSESKSETPLGAITNIQIVKTLAGRFLQYGHLAVRTYTGESVLRAVPLADQVQELIEYLIQESKNTDNEEEQAIFRKILKNKDHHSTIAEKYFIGKDQPFKYNKRNPSSEFDQTIMYRTHWVILFRKILLPSLSFISIILLTMFLIFNSVAALDSVFLLFGIFLTLSLAVVWWIYQFFDWFNDKYLIAHDQIIDINQKPFGREERRTASIFNLQSIRFERNGLMGILLNYGTVFIRIGDEEFSFDNVPDPSSVQKTIFQVLEKAISGKERINLTEQQKRLANWLDTYHKFQKDQEQAEQAE